MIRIYKITNPNGRIYIGQSVNIERRMRSYVNVSKQVSSSVKLYRSLKKHTFDNHVFEIIEECTVDKLNERERYFQDFYNATSDYNLNCVLTGTNDLKRVQKPLTDEQKRKVSLVHKGKVNSEETKAKIRLARSKQIITEEHKRKISENSNTAKTVLNTETGIFYKSAKEAANAHNFKPNYLVCRLIGRIKNKTSLKYV